MSIDPLGGGFPAARTSEPEALAPQKDKDMTIATVAEKAVQRPVQENKSFCWECKKKVGLLPMECKCGYVFCMTHRYPSSHKCDFDFRAEAQERLRRENPVIVADKIKDRI